MSAKLRAMCCCGLMGVAMFAAAGRMQAQATEADKAFLATASEADLAEIKQSQLALNKSDNQQVKDYAQRMITDHTMLENNLQPFAQKDGVTPATTLNAEHQAEMEKLNGLSGTEFDKEYIRSMDMDHHRALAAFDTELQTTQDGALKKTVKKGRKVVDQPMKMADKMSTKMGLPIAAM